MGDAQALAVEQRRGRRDGRWMMMWLFDGLASGAYQVAITVLSVLSLGLGDRADQIVLLLPHLPGYLIGSGAASAVNGLVAGLPVGVVMTFFVGDAHGPRARRRAMSAAAFTHAVAASAWLALLGYLTPLAVLWLGVLTLAMALVAGRWHDRLASKPREEPFYAD